MPKRLEDVREDFARAWGRSRSVSQVARELGISVRYAHTIRRQLEADGRVTGGAVDGRGAVVMREAIALDAAAEIRALRARLAQVDQDRLTEEWVKVKLGSLKVAADKTAPPSWTVRPPKGRSVSGVPTLFGSDWHWGEVVDPAEVHGVNAYDLSIAHARARTMIERAIDLLTRHVSGGTYPGIVFALGGDMVSGDIHDELSQTNDAPMLPVVLDLVAALTWCIKTLADRFGAVFVPCVTGNHGRMTKKPRAKQRAATNLDWLTYQLLAAAFNGDKRVSFLIPDGSDAHWKVYGIRYCLTHGDQFRGGDGMIGALGPVARGDKRKRSRNGQIGAPYDVLLMGHWHQLFQTGRFVVNGSLKGYDEYAAVSNFDFERAQQALWLTHPTHGITLQMPVHVQEVPQGGGASSPWVSLMEASRIGASTTKGRASR